MGQQKKIFISYSHEDKDWHDQLLKVLQPVIRNGTITVWSDKNIRPGSKWIEEIQTALNEVSLAIPLVSANYFNSEFIAMHELPFLLKAAASGLVRILWVAVSSSLFQASGIAEYQAINEPLRPLDCFISDGEANTELVKVAMAIVSAAREETRIGRTGQTADREVRNVSTSDAMTLSLEERIFKDARNSGADLIIARTSRDSLAIYAASRAEINRAGRISRRKPPPVVERSSGQSYASMNLAGMLIAQVARSGGSLPDSIVPRISDLPGFRIDKDSFCRDGYDIIYRAWLKQDDGSEKEVWARVGIIKDLYGKSLESGPGDLKG